MGSNDMNRKLSLKSTWRHGTVTLAEFAEKTIALLEDLRRLHPAYRRLNAADLVRMCDAPVPEDLTGYAGPLMDIGWDRLASYAFEPMNPEGESPLPESTSVQGYEVALYSAPPEDRSSRAVKVILRVGVDNFRGPNVCTLSFGDVEPFSSTGFQRELLATVMAHWPVDTSTLSSFAFSDEVHGSDPELYRSDRPPPLNIGWLTYVRRAGLAEALPAGTKVEPFGEPPGVLITLDGDHFEPDNPEQIAQVLKIREALRAANLLGNPSDTPDTEIDLKALPPLRENRRRE